MGVLTGALILGTAVLSLQAGPPEPQEPPLELRVSAFAGPAVVDSIDLAHPELARVLRIRVSRRDFRVGANRAVGFAYHKPTRWGVVTVRDSGAVVEIEIPTGIRRFTVRLGRRPIWVLDAAGAQALCEPVARVRRPDGGDDWVFDLESELVCRERVDRPRYG